MSHTDTFWKLFWISVGIITILFALIVVALTYFYNPARTADAAAVGVLFDASRDPFASKRPDDARPKFSGEYFYKDALPLSLADWSWGVGVNWNSTGVVYEGSNSFKITFREDWSGMRVNSSEIDLSDYQGISLAVYPDSSLGDLYIELFDSYGNSLGKQALSWYTPNQRLATATWNKIIIPLENLFPDGTSKRPITGYAISTVRPGVAYFDSVHLENNVAPHAKWYEPKPTEWQPEPPAPPISLPYILESTPSSVKQWKTVFGKFDLTPNGVRIGTIPEKTTGSMSYVLGGQNWTDYIVETTTYWGQTSSLSILVRYVDDANFISCAISNYGQLAQLYQVKKGVSTLLGSSPGLSIRAYEPWKDANAGASVQGNRVSCYVDDERVLSYEVPAMPSAGSAGVETWTRNTYDSPHILQEFTVKPL
jgi:hypothetical protein